MTGQSLEKRKAARLVFTNSLNRCNIKKATKEEADYD